MNGTPMASLAGKHILVVEDEPIVAMMVEDMLVELGATIVGPASSLDQAMALASESAIDAALLDVNLNGERSHGVADLLRGRGVPFVFATGYGSAGDDSRGEEVICKPYRAAQLADALARAIGR